LNHLISDNKVSTLRAYLADKLAACYDSREAGNIVHELFLAYNEWGRADVVLNAHQRLGESELLKYHFALKRLLHGEPLQYVLGYAWFLDLKLHVDKHVLIPRPETEELVRWVVSQNTLSNPRILDVGTGSGCIALALKKLIPGAIVTAIDVSDVALLVATKNAAVLDIDVEFMHADILLSKPKDTFDIIVSNPPYIPQSEQKTMNARLIEHEPHLALFTADDDALVFYRRLMELSAEMLNPNGNVFCEIHESMADALLLLAKDFSIQNPTILPDFQGKNRMMCWSI
jgi:release factor glutamine methyltransferase